MRKRRRGSRGHNWQRLTVQWRVAISSRYKSLPENEVKRMRLTAFLQALSTGKMPRWARISYLAWQNPDAEWEPEPINNDNESALIALSTLNKGNWLLEKVSSELEELGGALGPSTSKPHKKKRRKRKAKSEKLAKRGKKKSRSRHKRKTGSKKKRSIQKMGRSG